VSKTRLRHDRANPTYGLQAAVGSLIVPPDSGECVEALELIKSLPLEGAVVTGDAAFTFKAVVEAIRERGAEYFLFVVVPQARFQHDANQPELRAELARAFGDGSLLKNSMSWPRRSCRVTITFPCPSTPCT